MLENVHDIAETSVNTVLIAKRMEFPVQNKDLLLTFGLARRYICYSEICVSPLLKTMHPQHKA